MNKDVYIYTVVMIVRKPIHTIGGWESLSGIGRDAVEWLIVVSE